MPSVFYSWQSDRPIRENRAFIKEALELAIKELNGDVDDADRPDDRVELDHDTKGLPGSPDISSAILQKIDLADAFVADVTPIAITNAENGRAPRQVANPNVLIELGYAKKALGPENIVQVWNTAYTGCRPEDLPFDMRGRRGPISYSLSPGATKDDRQKALGVLAKTLRGAIAAVLAAGSTKPVVELWQTADEKDPSIWPTIAGAMTINEPDHGSGVKRVFPPPRSYVRILPSQWAGSNTVDHHDVLLGPSSGYSSGSTNGGIVTYPGTISLPHLEKMHAITKRFLSTGEVWGTKTEICGKRKEVLYVYGDEIIQHWADFIRYETKQMLDGGARLPFAVRAGVVGLSGLHWPGDTTFGRPPVALEDRFESTFAMATTDAEEIFQSLLETWINFRRIFSEPEPTMQQRQALMMRLR